MRTSNAYNKFYGYGQKKSGNAFQTVKTKFYFDYLDTETMKSSANMFKGLVFTAESKKIVTQQFTGLEPNDRIEIDGAWNLISNIQVIEEHKLGGQRFVNRKKTYIIEMEV